MTAMGSVPGLTPVAEFGPQGCPFTPADHRAICAFRERLQRQGGRHTLAADHEFSPEVLEVFAAGLEEAAFVLWREGAAVHVLDLRPAHRGPPALAGMDEALGWIGAALAGAAG